MSRATGHSPSSTVRSSKQTRVADRDPPRADGAWSRLSGRARFGPPARHRDFRSGPPNVRKEPRIEDEPDSSAAGPGNGSRLPIHGSLSKDRVVAALLKSNDEFVRSRPDEPLGRDNEGGHQASRPVLQFRSGDLRPPDPAKPGGFGHRARRPCRS
jgi:hypothetical protein